MTIPVSLAVILLFAILGVGFACGYFYQSYISRRQLPQIMRKRQSQKGDAEREARSIIKQAELQGRMEVLKAREAFEESIKDQRRELSETMANLRKREEGVSLRESNLDRKADVLDIKEEKIDRKAADAEAALAAAKALEKAASAAQAEADSRLQALTGMTRSEAEKALLNRAQSAIRGDVAAYLRRERERAERDAAATARKLVVECMQRYSVAQAPELMTRTVSIPSEDVKGRIIGREGRNIRAFEAASGCTLVLEPETVLISAADPLRREIAAIALEQLLASGKIQPQRIEDTIREISSNMEVNLLEWGSAAAAEARVPIEAPEVLRALGRLKFRTSYAQNVLRHSVEVAAFAGMLAAELGLDEVVARRVGLLHDIGKALDQEHSGPHARIGAELLRHCGESKDVIAGVEGHHGEVPDVTIWAELASVADAISSARPGARSESSELTLQRIHKLEELAMARKGVLKAFAFQAGRDLRVIIDPDAISDSDAVLLASELATQIAQQMQFPGQIRITVVRERRCISFAN